MNKKDKIFLDTFIPELPIILNNKFNNVDRKIELFYNSTAGIIVAPVQTTGRVKGATGEFATVVVDNMIVRNQFTNLYDNTTTADINFVNTYNGSVATTRSADPSIFLMEHSGYGYIDINKPYYKIDNTKDYAFQTDTLGLEFQLLFDVSSGVKFDLLLDPSTDSNNKKEIEITNVDASTTWIKLICTEVDPSWGATWVVKQYGGDYTINYI